MTHELILVISKDLKSATNKVVRTRQYDSVIPAGRWGVLFGFSDLQATSTNILAYLTQLQSMTEDDCTRPVAWFQQMYHLGGLVWDEIHKIVDVLPPEKAEKYNRNGYFVLPKDQTRCINGLLFEQDNPFAKHEYIRFPQTDKELYQKSWFFTVDPCLIDSKSKFLSTWSEKETFFDRLWESILNVRKGMHIFVMDAHY